MAKKQRQPKRKPNPQKKKRARRNTYRRIAQNLTVATVVLHLGIGALVYVTQAPAPQRSALMEMLWGHHNRPFLKVFTGWLLLSLLTSGLAGLIPGRHRYFLLAAWVAIVPILWLLNGDRLGAALRVLWHHVLN